MTLGKRMEHQNRISSTKRVRLDDAFARARQREPIFMALRKAGLDLKGKTVLEVGAGAGVNLPFIKLDNARRITAIEPFPAAVKLGRKLKRPSLLRLGRAEMLSRSEKLGNRPTVITLSKKQKIRQAIIPQHDVVISLWSFHAISDSLREEMLCSPEYGRSEEERISAANYMLLNELLRNVKPGGKLVIGDFLPKNRNGLHSASAHSIKDALRAISNLEERSYKVDKIRDFEVPFKAEGKHAKQLLTALKMVPGFEKERIQIKQTGKLDSTEPVDFFIITKPKSMRHSTPKATLKEVLRSTQ